MKEIILLLTVLFVGLIIAGKYEAKAPCEYYNNTAQQYIPARCISYFKN